MFGLDRLSILFYQIDPRDYPEYMECARSTEQPGTILMESRAMQGVRRVVPIGYLLSVLYFYGYRRPRLSFADRELSKLHHYFYPSAGYSTPIGILGGIAYACYYDGFCGCSEERAARAVLWERSKAMVAWRQHQRMQREKENAEGQQHHWLWSRLTFSWSGCGHSSGDDKAQTLSYEDFLDPYGVVSVGKQAVEVHDPSFYQIYSKEQVDTLVSAAMRLRKSPEEERWLRTSGRFGGYGIIGMLLTWNSGGMFFRLFMGLGFGVVCAGAISGAKLDS
ncbi:uncharacterized protein TEOVI_000777300 [Trypanosoma equiperdum]|uniref:Uncharacterized protein n=2 Tax=Trypanozoon TaxID=39700 RepID=Q385Z0_TRYB2|nr:hypothetical protein, conserved [Trypanosoma brucei brucei TREU927]EAN79391.1 hypothetical protein, conserved [Trypanosoma brucei brucei TREU927]SCU66595.1 hypothetical protein, conserved [Trypanosoma equiperdum]